MRKDSLGDDFHPTGDGFIRLGLTVPLTPSSDKIVALGRARHANDLRDPPPFVRIWQSVPAIVMSNRPILVLGILSTEITSRSYFSTGDRVGTGSDLLKNWKIDDNKISNGGYRSQLQRGTEGFNPIVDHSTGVKT